MAGEGNGDHHQDQLRGYVYKQPHVTYAFGQSLLKGEDYCLIETNIKFPRKGEELEKAVETKPADINDTTAAVVDTKWKNDTFDLYCIMDGHNGRQCAEYIKAKVLRTLLLSLPQGPPAQPDHKNAAEFQNFMQQISKALCKVFFVIEHDFAQVGDLSGSTCTIILRYGWYLTIASVGDSKCVLDSKATILEVTNDHRFNSDQVEKQRAENVAGTYIAKINPYNMQPCQPGDTEGVGPLRAWPGGLALSRSLGDFDAGLALICSPQIVQVQIPPDGLRIVMCTDGVWDYWQSSKVCINYVRRTDTVNAVQKLVKVSAARQGDYRKDDITVLVVDVKPREDETTQEVKQAQKQQNKFKKSKSTPCFNLFRRQKKPKFQLLEDSVKNSGSQSGYTNSNSLDSSGDDKTTDKVKQFSKHQQNNSDLFQQLPSAPLILHFIDVAVLQGLTKGLTIAPWSDLELIKKLDKMQKESFTIWENKKKENEPLVYAGQNFEDSEKVVTNNRYNVMSLEDLKKEEDQTRQRLEALQEEEVQSQDNESQTQKQSQDLKRYSLQYDQYQQHQARGQLQERHSSFQSTISDKINEASTLRNSLNRKSSDLHNTSSGNLRSDIDRSVFSATTFNQEALNQKLQQLQIKEEFHDSRKQVPQLQPTQG